MITENPKIDENFNIRKIKNIDANSLLTAGFPFGKRILKYSLLSKLSQYVGLSPQQTGFVAYSKNAKRIAGFLSLTKHPSSIQSIRYVFTNPDFRRKGIAKKLVLFAISYAKKQGAKKIFLSSDPIGPVTDFYKRLGFNQITNSQVIRGEGKTSKVYNLTKKGFFPLRVNLKKDLNLLFKIYSKCMGKNWINFFENDANNLIYGYSQEFKNLFYRSAYVTEQEDSFVFIYNRPFRHIAHADLYISPESRIESLFGELMNLFKQNNISYSKIMIFNVNSGYCYDLLKKNEFYPYSSIFSGKNLDANK